MALHGLIQVNGETIGGWSAVCRDRAFGEYECDVQMKPSPTRAAMRETFIIHHAYDDGALVLASKVLAEAAASPSVPA